MQCCQVLYFPCGFSLALHKAKNSSKSEQHFRARTDTILSPRATHRSCCTIQDRKGCPGPYEQCCTCQCSHIILCHFSHARKGATYLFCSLNLELQILPMTTSSVVFPVSDSVPRYDAQLLHIAPIIKQHLYEASNYIKQAQLCQKTKYIFFFQYDLKSLTYTA